MADSLNYQASHSAVYYTPPKRIDLPRTIAGTGIAAVLTIVGSIAYAKLQPNLSSIMVRGGAVFVAAFAVGVLGMIAVHVGKVRILAVAATIGAMLGLLALGVMWVVWVHDVLAHFGVQVEYWRFARRPIAFLQLIRYLNRHGTWMLDGDRVYGPPLAFFWLGEAAVILTGAVLLPIKAKGDDEAVCLWCGQKCRSIGRLPRFDGEQEKDLVAAIDSRDFTSLASFVSPRDQDAPELTLRVVSCPKCGQTNVLTVSRLAWGIVDGRRKVITKPLVNQLLITSAEVEQIREAKVMIEQRETEQEASEES